MNAKRVGLAPSFAILALSLNAQADAPAKPAPQPKAPTSCCAAPAPATLDPRGTPLQPLAVDVTKLPLLPPAPVPVLKLPEDRSGKLIAAATWALAVVTLGLAIFTYRLWLSTKALVTENTETAVRQLRAYVHVQKPTLDRVATGLEPRASITFVNYGKTPAYKLRVFLGMRIAAEFGELPPVQPPQESYGALGPTADFVVEVSMGRPLTNPEATAIHSGTATLFVHGEVHYIDAFKKAHWTRFRVKAPQNAGLTGTGLISCDAGNETDDVI
jgi:hypothetical protein